jgi:hypothetical protein
MLRIIGLDKGHVSQSPALIQLGEQAKTRRRGWSDRSLAVSHRKRALQALKSILRELLWERRPGLPQSRGRQIIFP